MNDLHSGAAPYALDAMDPDERAQFELHLEECPDCRAEVDGFTSTAVRLGQSVSQTPPSELRDRLMRSITEIQQERAVVTSLFGRSRTRRAIPRIGLAAAAALTVFAASGYLIERDNSEELRAEQFAVAQVITAPDATFISGHSADSAAIRMVMSKESDKAVIIADLPQIDADKVYQLWTITGKEPTSAGLLQSGNDVMVMSGVAGAQVVAVTVEPAGGSALPTSTPVAQIGTT